MLSLVSGTTAARREKCQLNAERHQGWDLFEIFFDMSTQRSKCWRSNRLIIQEQPLCYTRCKMSTLRTYRAFSNHVNIDQNHIIFISLHPYHIVLYLKKIQLCRIQFFCVYRCKTTTARKRYLAFTVVHINQIHLSFHASTYPQRFDHTVYMETFINIYY